MLIRDRDKDTICAVSTPNGIGGIAVIRVSGSLALSIISKHFRSKKFSSHLNSHTAYFGKFFSSENEAIDEVVVTYFSNGHSYTSENVIEISCHGSPQICSLIIDELVRSGCRPADRGEFTYRAFMNNQIDLVQAESIHSLIHSDSPQSVKVSLRQLQGSLSKQLIQLEDLLIWLLANIEASIDFSTENLDVINREEFEGKLSAVINQLDQLVNSYRSGRILKDGFQVALIGTPNVGKSSLLNAFSQEDKAIVTDIPGTTRDVVENSILRDGLKITFFDTAGIRDSSDVVERIGIERSKRALEDADLVVMVFDINNIDSIDRNPLDLLSDQKNVVYFANKTDLFDAKTIDFSPFSAHISGLNHENFFFGSANSMNTLEKLLSYITNTGKSLSVNTEALISQKRHFDNLSKSKAAAIRAEDCFKNDFGAEFVSIDLKESLLFVQETLGKRFDDQIMDRVFKEFCIGK